jgi:hypothetical protein
MRYLSCGTDQDRGLTVQCSQMIIFSYCDIKVERRGSVNKV